MIMLAMILAITVAALAADVTGKWTAQVPGRDGQMRETVFNFKVDGEKLSGTISGGQGGETPIADGVIKGDDISFNVVMSRGGNQMKMTYKGKVAGDEMKLTRTREGSDQTQEIVAKRAK
jgi:hypothetical protein